MKKICGNCQYFAPKCFNAEGHATGGKCILLWNSDSAESCWRGVNKTCEDWTKKKKQSLTEAFMQNFLPRLKLK